MNPSEETDESRNQSEYILGIRGIKVKNQRDQSE